MTTFAVRLLMLAPLCWIGPVSAQGPAAVETMAECDDSARNRAIEGAPRPARLASAAESSGYAAPQLLP